MSGCVRRSQLRLARRALGHFAAIYPTQKRVFKLPVPPPALPVIRLERVMHVGDLDASAKRTDSYEGSGLSVSLHPDEWREIARGFVGGSTWQLEKKGASFVDAHALADSDRDLILEWACAQELCLAADVFELRLYDDELDATTTQTFATRREAEDENVDEIPDAIVMVPGFASTPRLDSMARQSRPALGAAHVLDLVLPILAEQLGLDGVWWDDDLDVARLSAPRGMITTAKLAEWSISPAAHSEARLGKEEGWPRACGLGRDFVFEGRRTTPDERKKE